jgi:hypothetical protein
LERTRKINCREELRFKIKLKGVVSLLNKSDCEGFYSVGDSFDIVLMLNIISKRTDIEPLFMEIINGLKKVFQESVSKTKNVVIC